MLPRGLTRIAIVPVNTILHAYNVAKYSPYCEVVNGYAPSNLAVFLGYNPGQFQIVDMYKTRGVPTILWWMGSDVEMVCNMVPIPEDIVKYNYHVSTCQAQHDKLEKIGIKSEIQAVVPAYSYPIIKLDVNYKGLLKFMQPNRKKVMIYFPIGRYDQPLTWNYIKSTCTQDTYCIAEMMEIAESLPDVLFSFYGNNCPITEVPNNVGCIGRVDQDLMYNMYADHDILIRKTTHCEISQSIIECKQAGGVVICNHDLPFTTKAETVDQFIDKIKTVDTKIDYEGADYYCKKYNPQSVLELWAKYLIPDINNSVKVEFNREMNVMRNIE